MSRSLRASSCAFSQRDWRGDWSCHHGVVSRHSNYPCSSWRFITGLLEGNASLARAMLADKIEGDQRVQALAWLNGAVYSGWLVGP